MDELKKLIEELAKAFEQFKAANNERIKQLEAKGSVDPLLEKKVDSANDEISKLEKSISELETKLNRPGNQGGGDEKSIDKEAHRKGFESFLRKGNEDGLADLELKALNITTPGDGGYAVAEEIDKEILILLGDESPMRGLCKIITLGSADYKKLVSTGGAAAGWVDEDDGRTETDTPTLAALTPFMGEIYANPAATQQMLDDSFFPAESWLAEEVAILFGEQEGSKFVDGTGVKMPKGFLAYTSVTTGDATRTFGQLQHILAAATAAITSDELLDLVYSLKKKYRKTAVFQMSTLTCKAIRKLKGSDGQYIWDRSLAAGQPSTLLGFSLEENEDMPELGVSNVPIAFGDWKRGYTIVDKMGTRVLRDPYTNKPYVHFYTTKRVGGMVADSNAIKLLKNAAA
jgi:HK97 family phage major capsid protein